MNHNTYLIKSSSFYIFLYVLCKTICTIVGEELLTDNVPIPRGVQNIPGRESKAKFELVFQAKNIQPLGFKSFYVTKVAYKPSVFKENTQEVCLHYLLLKFMIKSQTYLHTVTTCPLK